jgi:hypothetical protein
MLVNAKTRQLLKAIEGALLETIQQEAAAFELGNSELVNNIKSRIDGATITITAPFYAEFVERGRKPGVRRVPISVLLKWIKKEGIGGGTVSANRLAFAIQRTIFLLGIQPRPFLKTAFKVAQDSLDKDVAKIFEFTVSDALTQNIANA